MQVGVKQLHKEARLPEYGTEKSACADIRASIKTSDLKMAPAYPGHAYQTSKITLNPGQRALVPTGLVFDIPEGYSLRVHPRSGLSFKLGMTVVCGEGVIDEDYQNELFVPMINLSQVAVEINDGDRIAQIELVKDERCSFSFVDVLSDKNSSRNGGFGHTGTN